MQEIKFGTDGWRAVISDDFTFENVRRVSQSIADYVNLKYKQAQKGMVVGYDTRFLSEKYAQIVSEVLAGNAIKVALSESAATTPMVSFTIKNRRLVGGIMITASHNPPQFNGIKFKADFGGSPEPDVTKQFEALIGANPVKVLPLEQAAANGMISTESFARDWIKFMRSYIDLEALKKNRFNIAIDIMHGAGAGFLDMALEGTNNKIISIHAERNPYFGGINPEPIEKNLSELISMTKKGALDIGLAVDGDVDRIGAVRPDGEFINPHQILSLILLHFVEDKRWSGAVVKTISGTSLIDKMAEELGLKLYETPVGFKHIAKLMLETDVLIGGEESGGLGFKNYIPERDGILSGILLVEMMAFRRKSIIKIMDELQKRFGAFCYERNDLPIAESLKSGLYEKLKKNAPSRIIGEEISDIKDYDGVKFITDNGSWVLFRLSGTEPIVRIYAESDSKAKARQLLAVGQNLAFK